MRLAIALPWPSISDPIELTASAASGRSIPQGAMTTSCNSDATVVLVAVKPPERLKRDEKRK